jgi:hypothetical protein
MIVYVELLLADHSSRIPNDLYWGSYHIGTSFDIIAASRMNRLVISVMRVMKISLMS